MKDQRFLSDEEKRVQELKAKFFTAYFTNVESWRNENLCRISAMQVLANAEVAWNKIKEL